MRFILYTLTDGSARIDRFMREDGQFTSGIRRRIEGGMSEEQAISEVAEKHKPDGATWRVADSSELPGGREDGYYDNTFVAAFCDQKGKIKVDMPKARGIHRDRLRELRKPLFAALDIQFGQALSREDFKSARAIDIKRQALRDVTADPEIEAADSPEVLAKVIPAVLA